MKNLFKERILSEKHSIDAIPSSTVGVLHKWKCSPLQIRREKKSGVSYLMRCICRNLRTHERGTRKYKVRYNVYLRRTAYAIREIILYSRASYQNASDWQLKREVQRTISLVRRRHNAFLSHVATYSTSKFLSVLFNLLGPNSKWFFPEVFWNRWNWIVEAEKKTGIDLLVVEYVRGKERSPSILNT